MFKQCGKPDKSMQIKHLLKHAFPLSQNHHPKMTTFCEVRRPKLPCLMFRSGWNWQVSNLCPTLEKCITPKYKPNLAMPMRWTFNSLVCMNESLRMNHIIHYSCRQTQKGVEMRPSTTKSRWIILCNVVRQLWIYNSKHIINITYWIIVNI